MKLILLAATALIAAPVLAQTTTPAPADQVTTPAPADPAATPAPADATTPAPADQAMAPAPAPAPQAGMAQPMSTGGATPAGGYAPSGSAISGGTPGSNLPPVFRPAPSPDQAYPAPAPLAKYPICKKGQYDQCMQRGGK